MTKLDPNKAGKGGKKDLSLIDNIFLLFYFTLHCFISNVNFENFKNFVGF